MSTDYAKDRWIEGRQKRVEQQEAEIERLREQLLICENKRLGGEQTEIERLRLENDGLKLAVKMRPKPELVDDPRQQEIITEQQAEIERLRSALETILTVPVGEGAAASMSKIALQALRVREALGEKNDSKNS